MRPCEVGTITLHTAARTLLRRWVCRRVGPTRSFLFTSRHYAGDYGFVPGTLHIDGDPLDVVVMTNEPAFAACVIEARPLAGFRLTDKGDNDSRILAAPRAGPLFTEYRDPIGVPTHFREEIAHLFTVYKDLEMAEVRIVGWDD